MLRNRIKRRSGKNRPPLSLIHGVVLETRVGFEMFRYGQIQQRDYRHDWDRCGLYDTELSRYDSDRTAWEHHWALRRRLRKQLQQANGPGPLRVRYRRHR